MLIALLLKNTVQFVDLFLDERHRARRILPAGNAYRVEQVGFFDFLDEFLQELLLLGIFTVLKDVGRNRERSPSVSLYFVCFQLFE